MKLAEVVVSGPWWGGRFPPLLLAFPGFKKEEGDTGRFDIGACRRSVPELLVDTETCG